MVIAKVFRQYQFVSDSGIKTNMITQLYQSMQPIYIIQCEGKTQTLSVFYYW